MKSTLMCYEEVQTFGLLNTLNQYFLGETLASEPNTDESLKS